MKKNIESVFIVEDNQLFSMLLEHNLKEKFKLRINSFTSGEDCLKNLNLKPDLIVLDYFLKGMNGMITLMEIKKINPKIPVVVISSQSNMQTALDFIKLGAMDYFEKKDNPIKKIMDIVSKYNS